MYEKRDYRTLGFVAKITSGFGWTIVLILGFLGLVLGWQAGGFLSGLLSGIISGLVLGIPLVVMGQMTSVFLDQKKLLENILDTIKDLTLAKAKVE